VNTDHALSLHVRYPRLVNSTKLSHFITSGPKNKTGPERKSYNHLDYRLQSVNDASVPNGDATWTGPTILVRMAVVKLEMNITRSVCCSGAREYLEAENITGAIVLVLHICNALAKPRQGSKLQSLVKQSIPRSSHEHGKKKMLEVAESSAPRMQSRLRCLVAGYVRLIGGLNVLVCPTGG
jgi:hypothetical protein